MHAVPIICEHIVQPHRSNPDTATEITSSNSSGTSYSSHLTNSSPWELANTITMICMLTPSMQQQQPPQHLFVHQTWPTILLHRYNTIIMHYVLTVTTTTIGMHTIHQHVKYFQSHHIHNTYIIVLCKINLITKCIFTYIRHYTHINNLCYHSHFDTGTLYQYPTTLISSGIQSLIAQTPSCNTNNNNNNNGHTNHV